MPHLWLAELLRRLREVQDVIHHLRRMSRPSQQGAGRVHPVAAGSGNAACLQPAGDDGVSNDTEPLATATSGDLLCTPGQADDGVHGKETSNPTPASTNTRVLTLGSGPHLESQAQVAAVLEHGVLGPLRQAAEDGGALAAGRDERGRLVEALVHVLRDGERGVVVPRLHGEVLCHLLTACCRGTWKLRLLGALRPASGRAVPLQSSAHLLADLAVCKVGDDLADQLDHLQALEA